MTRDEEFLFLKEAALEAQFASRVFKEYANNFFMDAFAGGRYAVFFESSESRRLLINVASRTFADFYSNYDYQSRLKATKKE